MGASEHPAEHAAVQTVRVQKACRELAKRLAEAGLAIQYNGAVNVSEDLRPRVDAMAACTLLMQKGICSQAEVDLARAEALHELLEKILQAMEEAQLRMEQQQHKLAVARRSGIVVAK